MLDPDILLRHVALFLLVLAMAMPGIFYLRVAALASAVISVILAGFVSYDGVALFWSIPMVVVLAVQIALHWQRDAGRPLLAEERLFHEKIVPSLTTAQTRRLLSAGQWRDVAAGTVLTREGEMAAELFFVARGIIDVLVAGERVSEVRAGSLLGEFALVTGRPAAATTVCATPARYLGFESGRLTAILDRHAELQDAVEIALEKSLRGKIQRRSLAVAHLAGTAPP